MTTKTLNPLAPLASRELIVRLRRLRADARRLHSSLVSDLLPFKKEDNAFRTWPDRADPKVSVATTSTAIMALIVSNKHVEVFKDKSSLVELFKSVVSAEWRSSELPDKNAFTIAMVLRAAGFLVRAKVFESQQAAGLTHPNHEASNLSKEESLREIVQEKAKGGGASFKVEEYPPKTTLGYWFVDGAIGMDVELDEESWKQIATWAAQEFHRELIYVSAGNDSLMDPPSLAMAACLINRIRRYCAQKKHLVEISRNLPSPVELGFGIEQVFTQQSDSGIWHKYFPMFHFPKGQGAADYCFSFEFLEAILIEFGIDVLRKVELLDGFEKAVRWCDKYRLVFQHEGIPYRGWNSGGEVKNLAAGKPESWATASVHMFLSQLERKIDRLLEELVLARFGRDRSAVVNSTDRLNKKIIDIDLVFPDEEPTTLLTVIKEEIIAQVPGKEDDPLFRLEIPVPRSVLLFGPPGTSKTNLARAIAEALGWPLIVITPSEFLGKGLEQVHAQVNEVFEDLMDLSDTVIFFDEMDALAQTRAGENIESEAEHLPSTRPTRTQKASVTDNLDVTRQLLTTSMLPKLANLWDQKRVMFLMATNHRKHLDVAITRPGRFDLLLCVASPTWEKKTSPEALKSIFSLKSSKRINGELRRLTPQKGAVKDALDRFTVTEVGIFLDHLKRLKKTGLLAALAALKPQEFRKIAEEWAKTSITLRERFRITTEHTEDIQSSRRQYYPNQK